MNPLPLILRFLFAGFGNKVEASNRPPSSRSAAINRWTNKPHGHKRARARGHTHDRRHTNERFEERYGT